MNWRSYSLETPKSKNVQSTHNTSTISEPPWVAVLPAARGLWSMIVTFRQRGNHQIADNLEAAAEKQAEAHLKTQQVMMEKYRPVKCAAETPQSPAAYEIKEDSNKQTPLNKEANNEVEGTKSQKNSSQSSQKTSNRNSQCSQPSRYSLVATSESEWESEVDLEDKDQGEQKHQNPSGDQ